MWIERYSEGQKSSTGVAPVYFSFKLAARRAKPEYHLSFGAGIRHFYITLKQAEEEPGTKSFKGETSYKI